VIFARTKPGELADPELLMLVLVGGKGRSLDDFRELGREAGLEMMAHSPRTIEFKPTA